MKRLYQCVMLLLILGLLGSAASIAAFAEDEPEQLTPEIYLDDVMSNQGEEFTLLVYARDFVDVSALELYLFYDENVLTLQGCDVGWMASDAQTSTNTDQSGEVMLNLVSGNGISGTGPIWYLSFKVHADAPIGNSVINIAAGEVYSKDLSPIELQSASCRVSVMKSDSNTIPDQIYPYFYLSASSAEIKDTVTAQIAISNPQNMSAAVFGVAYDAMMLKLTDVKLGSNLTGLNGAIWSVDDAHPGYVTISFASLGGLTYYTPDALTATFEVIGNVDETTEISMSVEQVYREDLVGLQGGSETKSLSLHQVLLEEMLPRIFVEQSVADADRFELGIFAEDETLLAAGDFIVSYDPSVLICTAASGTTDGCMVISNIIQEKGLIKFSFICEDGIVMDTELIHLSFEKKQGPWGQTTVSLSATNVVDAAFDLISVKTVDGQVVFPYIPGDANGDGFVNSTDIVFLRRYIAGGYGVIVNEKAGNVNADDDLNTTDIVWLRRAIAGGYGIELKPAP